MLPPSFTLGRRAFLTNGALTLTTLGISSSVRGTPRVPPCSAPDGVTFGLLTDLHHADKPAAGSRHYRETLGKLAEATERFRKEQPAFVVELGDLIDAAPSVETELAYLKTVNKALANLCEDRHYVLGNHCVDTLTKTEFLDQVQQKKSYYSFERGGVHFVVLDSCFRSDGEPYGRNNAKWNDPNIPAAEIDWLKDDLRRTDKPVIVFAHQRLDVANDYGVKNAPTVRQVLEQSGRVLAVFQGHSHKNDYKDIGGIHYCTLVAMIEGTGPTNNGYSLVRVQADGTIQLTGFRQQKNYTWIVKKS